jgi:hypothetical protein
MPFQQPKILIQVALPICYKYPRRFWFAILANI